MKRKIIIVSILAVFMLLAISYSTAINANITNTGKKESPLWGIRTKKAISEKIGMIIENIKTKFLGERLFFMPLSFLYRNDEVGLRDQGEYTDMKSYPTCFPTACPRGGPTVCSGCTMEGDMLCETSDWMKTCKGLLCMKD